MVLVGGIEGIVGRVAIRRIGRVAGIKAVGRVEGIIRREGLRGIQRIIRRILTGRIEDIVARSYCSEKFGSAKEGVTTKSKTIRTRTHIESLQAQASQLLNSALRTQHLEAALLRLNLFPYCELIYGGQ